MADDKGDPMGAAVDEVEQALLRAAIDTLIDWIRSKWHRRSQRKQVDQQTTRNEQQVAIELSEEKEAILAGKVNAAALHLYSGEVSAVLSQIEIRRNNINLLESQRAQWGEALVPAVIMNSIRAESRELDTLVHRLQSLLQAILGQPLPGSFDNYLAISADDNETGG
jgi:hypothetical protein